MRAGRLKTRRYKIKRRGRGWLWVLALLLIAAGAWRFSGREFSLRIAPAPTLTPQDSAPESRTLVLPARSWYALQLGTFDQEEAARSLSESYRGRGAAGYVYASDRFRVLAAAYDSRSGAQAVQTQLRSQHGVESTLVDLPRPEITLRLTGQKTQLAALEDAYRAVDQTGEQLSALSQALDERRESEGQILSSLRSQRETAAALRRQLESRFGDHPIGAVSALTALLGDLVRGLDGAIAASGDTARGAQIKYCQLLCICRMADYAQQLAR